MDDAGELALVRAALADPVSNSVRWAGGVTARMSRDLDLDGLQPIGVREALRAHARSGGRIVQKVETWEPYKDQHRFCYEVLLEFDFIARPVFVEMRYTGIDPDLPQVSLVSVHTSFKDKSRP